MKINKALTREQEINLLWLEIKKDNKEISEATYKAVKSCIKSGKRIANIKGMSAIEKKYFEVFTMPKNSDFITECFLIQDELSKMLKTQ